MPSDRRRIGGDSRGVGNVLEGDILPRQDTGAQRKPGDSAISASRSCRSAWQIGSSNVPGEVTAPVEQQIRLAEHLGKLGCEGLASATLAAVSHPT